MTFYFYIYIYIFIYLFSSAGCKLCLPEWGVSLLIPEGALDHGYTEEVFLEIMREGRDRPSLASNQESLFYKPSYHN